MANTREAELHYPLGDTLPEIGRTLEIAPGVRWLRMALPFALDHINLWLLRDEIDGESGWTVVDCGISSEPTMAAWEAVFANELEGLPILRVVCTHMHPDHIGLAHWLTQRWSNDTRECRLWISATDWNAARTANAKTIGVGGPSAAAFFARHGLVDEDSLEKVRQRANHYASLVPAVPDRFRRLLDGARITVRRDGESFEWHCIAGYGHAPEHMALHCPALGVLIAGDMVLPRISTNVSVADVEPEANPLQLYLDSIGRMRSLPADTLVLPSHGKPFTGLHQRIRQLFDHHDERLADVMTACAESPKCAADLLMLLFRRKLDLHQTTFAMGESLAHLHALWHLGRLRRQIDPDGIVRFTAAA